MRRLIVVADVPKTDYVEERDETLVHGYGLPGDSMEDLTT